jgi:hypothetical protein
MIYFIRLIYSDGKDETKPPGWKQLVMGSINNIVNHANPTASPSLEKSSKEVDKLQECVTNITNCKSNIRHEIRTLLRHISNRDQVYLANRKALQFLDRECKHIVVIALKALISREKEVRICNINCFVSFFSLLFLRKHIYVKCFNIK